MSSKNDAQIITWGVLVSLITVGTMMILGASSNDSTELALKLIIAVLIPLVSIVAIIFVKRLIQR